MVVRLVVVMGLLEVRQNEEELHPLGVAPDDPDSVDRRGVDHLGVGHVLEALLKALACLQVQDEVVLALMVLVAAYMFVAIHFSTALQDEMQAADKACVALGAHLTKAWGELREQEVLPLLE